MPPLQLKEVDEAEEKEREKELRSRLSRLAIKKRSLLRPMRVSVNAVRGLSQCDTLSEVCVFVVMGFQHDGARRFQYAWRCYVLRKHLKVLLRSVWVRKWEPYYEAYYYLNTNSNVSSWEIPLCLKYTPIEPTDGPLAKKATRPALKDKSPTGAKTDIVNSTVAIATTTSAASATTIVAAPVLQSFSVAVAVPPAVSATAVAAEPVANPPPKSGWLGFRK